MEIENTEIVGPVIAPNGGPLDGFESFELASGARRCGVGGGREGCLMWYGE